MEEIINLAPTVFVAFGTVAAVSVFKKDLKSQEKWFLAVIAALVWGFVPADFGNELVNRVKDAIIAGGAGTAAVAAGLSRIAGK